MGKIWSPDRTFWSPIYFKLIYEEASGERG